MQAIGEILQAHTPLKQIDISFNSIGPLSISNLSSGIASHPHLLALDMRGQMSTEIVTALGEAIVANKSLQEVDIWSSLLSSELSKRIIDHLIENQSVPEAKPKAAKKDDDDVTEELVLQSVRSRWRSEMAPTESQSISAIQDSLLVAVLNRRRSRVSQM
eukprot:c12700_g1_i2.p2 GENE.c12700_g1_i2~~c12700_g1_i2.p2  ORF type:complete len:160 (+),score=37.57 c12700_g1_i2:549-1028(+)